MFTVRRRHAAQFLSASCLTAMVTGVLTPAAAPTWRDALAQSVSLSDTRNAAGYRAEAAAALAATAPDDAATLTSDAGSGYADGDRILPDRADELNRNAHAAATSTRSLDWGGTNIGAGVSVGLNELARGDEPGRAQIMILLTDGEGSWRVGPSEDLLRRLQDEGIPYTIWLP